MACKIIFCSKFPDIPDKAGKITTGEKTQAIAKRFAFHANTKRRVSGNSEQKIFYRPSNS